MAVEVVLRLPNSNKDIESTQDAVMDALYAVGFTRIESISVTLIDDDDSNPCGCV